MIWSTCKVSNPLSDPRLNWWWWWREGSEHRITRPTTTPRRIIVRIVPRSRTNSIENPSSASSRSCLIGYPTFLQRKVRLLVRKLQYMAYTDKAPKIDEYIGLNLPLLPCSSQLAELQVYTGLCCCLHTPGYKLFPQVEGLLPRRKERHGWHLHKSYCLIDLGLPYERFAQGPRQSQNHRQLSIQ